MKNILFLDIDGVLNNTISHSQKPICGFHSSIYANKDFYKSEFNFNQSSIDALNYIIYKTNCDIVISSNWRFGSVTVNDFKRLFDLFGINATGIDMIDATIEENSIFKRSFNIAKYLSDYQKLSDIGKLRWVAIDDRIEHYHSDFMSNTVITNPDDGLTLHDANLVVNLFNSVGK